MSFELLLKDIENLDGAGVEKRLVDWWSGMPQWLRDFVSKAKAARRSPNGPRRNCRGRVAVAEGLVWGGMWKPETDDCEPDYDHIVCPHRGVTSVKLTLAGLCLDLHSRRDGSGAD
jgi:hypothetical protein